MCGEFIPKRLGAKHQRDIFFAFTISVADKTGIAVVAALLMRRYMRIGHQDL
ncbi:Uncharacterised protein [Salmonella enterica subsp. enterica serovar Bovismorbificans]|uniref:Uncharacterized protein n=1 Tax=Salmonella enterica subsp. enterica serovar Bovismorbificans TaxID=58097 RepID=A0A655EHH0_SALET|nr:Uncharacterised protein [Salmonella enterica subsp. enterica serovar Bovismorbificans]